MHLFAGRLDGVAEAQDAGVIAHVQFDRDCFAAEGFDLSNEWREVFGAPAGDDQVRTGASQGAKS